MVSVLASMVRFSALRRRGTGLHRILVLAITRLSPLCLFLCRPLVGHPFVLFVWSSLIADRSDVEPIPLG